MTTWTKHTVNQKATFRLFGDIQEKPDDYISWVSSEHHQLGMRSNNERESGELAKPSTWKSKSKSYLVWLYHLSYHTLARMCDMDMCEDRWSASERFMLARRNEHVDLKPDSE